MNVIFKKFNDLKPEELYKILKLRFNVFVKEQNSIYNEFGNILFLVWRSIQSH